MKRTQNVKTYVTLRKQSLKKFIATNTYIIKQSQVLIAHACNPGFERLRLGGWWSKVSLSKKFTRPYLNQ
jgi:hypothetical protein